MTRRTTHSSCWRALVFGVVCSLVVCARAGSLQTRTGSNYVGELRFTGSNGVQVAPAQGEPVLVPLTNVLRATFSSGPFLSSGSVLPNGWSVQDIGEGRGATRLDEDTFALRVEGQGTNASACHLAGRNMHSDGEISARVDEVTGPAARGGIMLRAREGSIFASLACDAAGKVWFERRPEKDRKEIHAVVVANRPAPVWLRLYKRDKVVLAFVSTNGSNWEMVGRDSINLTLERTWREHEGELNLLRGSFGVFASSRAKGVWTTARVSRVSMALNGVLGEYFSGADFKRLAFTRLDPQVRFDWRDSRPDPLLGNEQFSVRWTGTLVPLRSAMARFYFDGADSTRLWINGEDVEQLATRKTNDKGAVFLSQPSTVRLTMGESAKVKMEFQKRAAPASARLSWVAAGEKLEVIGMTNFVYSFTATNSPDFVVPRVENNSPAVRGIVLRDGTFLAGPITGADESAVKISFGGRQDVPVLNTRVARIVVRPPRQSLAYGVASGRTGVFLKNGDFFESEFRNITHGALQMSSLLFGTKRFWIEGGDATVVVLNDCRPSLNTSEVRLLDGSALRVTKMAMDTSALTVEEPLLGRIVISSEDIWEIRNEPISAKIGQ